jgi:hypothetical protein
MERSLQVIPGREPIFPSAMRSHALSSGSFCNFLLETFLGRAVHATFDGQIFGSLGATF